MRAPTLLLLLLTNGCYMHSLENRPWSPNDVYASDTTVHFLWGITGATTRAGNCAHGFDRVAAYMPWWGGIVSLITAGIVVPTTVDFICAPPHYPRRGYPMPAPGAPPGPGYGTPPPGVAPGYENVPPSSGPGYDGNLPPSGSPGP